MRSVIVDHLRRQRTPTTGRAGRPVTLSTAGLEALPAPDVLQLDDVLQQLAPRRRARPPGGGDALFFGGLELTELPKCWTSRCPRSKRDWQRARAFLFEALQS